MLFSVLIYGEVEQNIDFNNHFNLMFLFNLFCFIVKHTVTNVSQYNNFLSSIQTNQFEMKIDFRGKQEVKFIWFKYIFFCTNPGLVRGNAERPDVRTPKNRAEARTHSSKHIPWLNMSKHITITAYVSPLSDSTSICRCKRGKYLYFGGKRNNRKQTKRYDTHNQINWQWEKENRC